MLSRTQSNSGAHSDDLLEWYSFRGSIRAHHCQTALILVCIERIFVDCSFNLIIIRKMQMQFFLEHQFKTGKFLYF